MSSVAGVRSLQGESEETYDHICDPCNYRGIQKQGTSYCKQCQETLCQSCTDAHTGQKMSRNHDLISVSKLSVKVVPSATSRVLCDCSQNSAVVVYCQDHDDVICQSCSVIKHRACKTVSIVEKSASYQKEKFTAVTRKADKLNDDADDILNGRKSDFKSFTTMTEKAKDAMRKYRQEINTQLDKMEQAILTELNSRKFRNRQEVDGHISSCTTTKQLIQSDLKILNDVKKTAVKADMFAADVQISKRLAEYERLLRDVHGETKSTSLTFRQNDQILDMLKNIKNVGTLVEHTTETAKMKKNVFTDLKVGSLSQINVTISKDQEQPTITGCAFMPDGKVILCDWDNKNLKRFDQSFTVQDSLDLPSRPWDISAVNDTTAIITLPDKQQLQYIEVSPQLTGGRVLQLDRRCWGVQFVGSDIYVTFHRSYFTGGEGEVRILDKNGTLKKRLGVNKDKTFMFTGPDYLTVSARSNRIYVSDLDQHTLTCLKPDGTVIFQYKDPELHCPLGVCVDDEDNVIVCVENSNNIHVVTNGGKKHSVILTDNDGIKKPYSVAYRQTDQTLIVGCRDNDNLYVVHCGAK